VPASSELLVLLGEPTLTRSTTINKKTKGTLKKKTKVKKSSTGLKTIRRSSR